MSTNPLPFGTKKHGIIEPSNLPQRFFTNLLLFTTKFRNLARLKIDRFQNVICNGLLCQVFSVELHISEMWPIARAFSVLLKASTRLLVMV
jgi:hypothetical protein